MFNLLNSSNKHTFLYDRMLLLQLLLHAIITVTKICSLICFDLINVRDDIYTVMLS